MYRGTHAAVPDERNEHDSPIARLQSVVRSSHRGGRDRDHADSASALTAGALNRLASIIPRKSLLHAATFAAIALLLSSISPPQTSAAQTPMKVVSPKQLPTIASEAITVLYEGSLNTGTPDTQGFLYLTNPLLGAQATQAFTTPVTTLDTTVAYE